MRTDTIVKKEGMDALTSCLGFVDAERFIMLMNQEHFDYTIWREKGLDTQISVRELSKKAVEFSLQNRK